jgi:hypothetical protein
MSQTAPLITTEAGITHSMTFDEGRIVFSASQDTDAVIEANKAMLTHNDGYSPSRELRRVASIPLVILYKWMHEEGWDPFDRRHADRLARKLNDPDWAHLRTAPGRVAPLPGGGLR